MPNRAIAIRSAGSGGRPPKFAEPRRPVTVTLPERTLRQLAALDEDRARAIVRATDAVLGATDGEAALVRLVELEPGTAIILVAASRFLPRIPFLHLVEVGTSSHLLAILPGISVESLELELLDLLGEVPPEDKRERAILTELRDMLRGVRRRKTLSKAEILLIATGRRRRKS